MKTFRMALLGTALLATGALPALAQPAPAGPPPAGAAPAGPAQNGLGPMRHRDPGMRGDRGAAAMFDQADANKDGKVTWDEAWVLIQQRFTAADPDHDGSLTQQEMLAMRMGPARRDPPPPPPGGDRGAMRDRMMGMMFRGLDANRDGVVTLEEIKPMAEARFRGFDANGDGVITKDELPAPPPRRPGPPPASRG